LDLILGHRSPASEPRGNCCSPRGAAGQPDRAEHAAREDPGHRGDDRGLLAQPRYRTQPLGKRDRISLNPAVGLGCPLCDVGWDNRGLRFRRG